MFQLPDIIHFLREQIGILAVSENDDIADDLGVDGDDFDDLLLA